MYGNTLNNAKIYQCITHVVAYEVFDNDGKSMAIYYLDFIRETIKTVVLG
jgi:hypothetical protein